MIRTRTLALVFLIAAAPLLMPGCGDDDEETPTTPTTSGSWSALGAGFTGTVQALASYRGHLIAGGGFSGSGQETVEYIARWDGTAWQPLGAGLVFGNTPGTIDHLLVYGNKLIAAGSFLGSIAQWDGSSWGQLGPGPINAWIRHLALHNGQLIVAGSFTDSNLGNLAAWNGSAWAPYGAPTNPQIGSVASHGGELFASSTRFPGNVARWDGTSWQPLGEGVEGINTVYVWDMISYGGQLVVGGNFWKAGGQDIMGLAQWSGSQWSSVGGFGKWVYCLMIHEGNLIVGHAGGVSQWNGSQWTSLGTWLSNQSTNNVRALTVHEGHVVAGGEFTYAGQAPANRVARWNQ